VALLEKAWLLDMLLGFREKAGLLLLRRHSGHRQVSVDRKIWRKLAETRL
jgi:hypothetical protein